MLFWSNDPTKRELYVSDAMDSGFEFVARRCVGFCTVQTGEKNATAEDIGRVAIVATAGFNADQTTSVDSVAVGVPILFAEIVLTSADR